MHFRELIPYESKTKQHNSLRNNENSHRFQHEQKVNIFTSNCQLTTNLIATKAHTSNSQYEPFSRLWI